MTSLIKKVQNAFEHSTTYRIGLLQTKAYRILKQRTAEGLKQHNLSSVEWALLGLLHDSKSGMRLSALAHELGVEAPFVTQMLAKLKKAKFVKEETDPEDSRAKIAVLSEEGATFVPKTEKELRAFMRPLLKDASVSDVLGYMAVLKKLIDNG